MSTGQYSAGRFYAKTGPTRSGLKTDPCEDQAGLTMGLEYASSDFKAMEEH